MKIGARILKTGIAIILALSLSQLLDLPSPAFAGIAAIFAIQPTIFRSYRTIIEQLQGNAIGAAIAIVFVLVFGNNVFFVGLACIIVILINVKMKTESTLTLAVVTVIAIMENQSGNFFSFAFERFFTIMIGIFSSFVVNLLFIPPKYETKLYQQITSVSTDITKWIRISMRHASEHTHIKNDLLTFKDQVIKIEQLYLMYKEDKELFKKASKAKARKLVVYRQMLTTAKRALDILKKLNKYENQFLHMPEHFQADIKDKLDYLVTQHEHVNLKYIRKTKTTAVSCKEPTQSHQHLLNLFLTIQKKLEGQEDAEHHLYHMMALISAIVEYEENIQHLDTLITSYQAFHKDDDKLTPEAVTE